MKVIGVRELRQRASEHLQEVAKGRSLEVTARGKPIAQLVPVRAAGRRQQLVSRGRLTPAAADVLRLGAPMAPVPGVATASARLARARAHER